MTNKHRLFLLPIALMACFSFKAMAQHELASYASDSLHRSQNIYMEAGGPGFVLSINYDTRFGNSRAGLGATGGVGFLPGKGSYLLTIPLQLNYLWGAYQHYFELGAGGTFMKYKSGAIGDFVPFHDDINKRFAATTTIGYRYQPIDGGINFRVSFNPVFDTDKFYPYAGIGVGYTFWSGK
jgi:hypothetical protein